MQISTKKEPKQIETLDNPALFQSSSLPIIRTQKQSLTTLLSEYQNNDVLKNQQLSEERIAAKIKDRHEEWDKTQAAALNNGLLETYTSTNSSHPLRATHYTSTTSILNDKWVQAKKTPRTNVNSRYLTPQRKKEIGFAAHKIIGSKQKSLLSKIPIVGTEATAMTTKHTGIDSSPSYFENRLNTEEAKNESTVRETFLMKIDAEIDKLFVDKHTDFLSSSYSDRKYLLSKTQKEFGSMQKDGEVQSPKQMSLPQKLKPIRSDHRRSRSTRGPIPTLKLESLTTPHKDTQGNASLNKTGDFRSTLKHVLTSKSTRGFSEDRRNSSSSRSPHKKSVLDTKSLPEWLKKHPEFREAYIDKIALNKKMIPDICDKYPNMRRYDEKLLVANWIHSVELFKNLPSTIHFELAGRLTVNYYNEGDIICKQGAEGHCLYIIYDGIIEVFVNTTMVAVYRNQEALGRQALEHSAPRNATLRARTKSVVLILDRRDYQGIMMKFINQEKMEYIKFMKTLPFFKELSESKLRVLCANLSGKFFYKDDQIYNKGDEAFAFYIVREGKVSLEANIQVEKENKWPVDLDKWKVRKITRTVVYRENLEGEKWFGEIELIHNQRRINRAFAAEDAFVLYLNKSCFMEILDAEDQRKLVAIAELQPIFNSKKTQGAILNDENSRKYITKVMIDALNSNMRSRSVLDLEKYRDRKIKPMVNDFRERLAQHLRKTTIRINRNEEIVSDNLA